MHKGKNWRDWLWIPATVLAGFWMAFWERPYFDPLLGRGLAASQDWILLNAFLAGLAVFLMFRKGWRVVSPLLLLFVLLAGVPLASKAGLKLELANDTDALVQATVQRTKDPRRRVYIAVPPHTNFIYQTAPADHPETLELTVAVSSSQLTTSIQSLRTNLIVWTSNGLALRAAANQVH